MTNAELGEILRLRLRMTAAYCGLRRPFGKLTSTGSVQAGQACRRRLNKSERKVRINTNRFYPGREKKERLVAVTAWAKSDRDICLNSAKNLAVWNIKAGSFVFCFRIGSGDI